MRSFYFYKYFKSIGGEDVIDGRSTETTEGVGVVVVKKSDLEEQLAFQIEGTDLPVPCRECTFHPTRRWRFDFCWPDIKVAMEVEGGTWSGGRHTRGSGFRKDCDKYNQAAILGWVVLRVTSDMVQDLTALRLLEQVFERR